MNIGILPFLSFRKCLVAVALAFHTYMTCFGVMSDHQQRPVSYIPSNVLILHFVSVFEAESAAQSTFSK
jgi:hypothetical protein